MRKLAVATLLVALASPGAWAQQKKSKPAPAPAAQAAPETVSVTVTQEADIRGEGRVAEAKEEARNRALRTAVEQVVGTHVTAFTESRDFTLLQDYVTSHSTGYVSSYKVLDERVDEDGGVVAVTVKAEVSKGQIDADSAAIATLLSQRKQRYIYVSISDRTTGTVGGEGAKTAVLIRHGIFDLSLRDQLRKDGFITLDPNMADGGLKAASAVESINSVGDAVRIANALKADVIVYGQATTSVRPPSQAPTAGSGRMEIENMVYSTVTEVALSIVSPHTEEEIGSFSGEARGVGHTEDEAVRNAVEKAAGTALKDVRRALFAAWLKQQQSGSSIKVTIAGLKRYSDFGELQRMLTGSSHQIKSIDSARYDKGTGSFALLVGPGVTSDTLANSLGGKAFKGMTISVTGVRPAVLDLELTK